MEGDGRAAARLASLGGGYATKPPACKGCPAYEWGVGFVPPEGPHDSRLVIVGQGPGEQEAYHSRPFFERAPSGGMLSRWLRRAGVARSQVLVTNCVLCWLPTTKRGSRGVPSGNRAPTQAEVEFCWQAHVGPVLGAGLDEAPVEGGPRVVLAVGSPAAKSLLSLDGGVEKYLGTFNKVDLPPLGDPSDRQGTDRTRSQGPGVGAPAGPGQGGEQVQGRTVRPRPHGDARHDQVPDHPQPSGSGDERRPVQARGEAEPVHSFVEPVELSSLREENQISHPEVSLLQRSKASSPVAPYVVPVLHPSAIMRGRWIEEPAQALAVKRAAGVALKGESVEPYVVDYSQPPPNTNLYPNLNELAEFLSAVELAGGVALDIESAGHHIICVGMTVLDMVTYETGGTLCLRFRTQGGKLYWNRTDHTKAVELLQGVLSNPRVVKVFQNGITFDVPELQALGFEVVGPFLDTMHMAHCAYPELPKGLQYLSTVYLGMPVWKTLTDEEELEGKG